METASPVVLMVDADLDTVGHDDVLVQDRVSNDRVAADAAAGKDHRLLNSGPFIDNHVR